MIDPQLLRRAFESGFSPLPGKCLVELDAIPTMSGLLHIPDSAQELKEFAYHRGDRVYGDTSWTGKILAVTPRRSEKTGILLPESFSPGDRVVFLLLKEDLNQEIIVTTNTRICAVVTPQ